MKNQVCLLTILVVNFLHCAHGFGRFRLARRQIGLGSFIFPEDSPPMPITTISGALKRPSSSGVVNKVVSNMPESLQNLIGIDKDDLDYFEVEPLDDRFGEKPKETKCKIGRQQSPIDVDTSDTVWKEYPPLEMNGHWRFKHKVLLFNEGHTIMLKEKGGMNRPKISGGPLRDTYTFEQLHFHWGPDSSQGSEHTINGQSYAAEAHMVHYQTRYGSYKKAKENKGLLVLGYLFQVSDRQNDELSDFIDPIPLMSRFRNVTFSSPDILRLFKKASKACYFHYTGSLTTGDCSEGVLWILFNQTIPISSQQLSQFRRMYGSNGAQLRSNYRETQRLYGREVEFVTMDGGPKLPRRGEEGIAEPEEEYSYRPSRVTRPSSSYGRY